jgi:hypothetical protein
MNPMRMSGLLPRHLGTRRDALSTEPAVLSLVNRNVVGTAT